MKDLAWLREEVEKLDTEESQRYPHWEAVWKAEVIDLIDQVENPVIPDYVAEYIAEMKKKDMKLYQSLKFIMKYGWDDKKHDHFKIYKWFITGKNDEVFAQVWRNHQVIESKETIKVNVRELLEQVEAALDLEYLKPVDFTRGERFGRHGYVKEIVRDVELNEVIELNVNIIEKELEE